MAQLAEDILVDVGQFLNNIIETEGEIKPNMTEIWKTFLHKWNNDDWENIFSFLLTLANDHPELLKDYQRTQIMYARGQFLSNKTTKRCMDTKPLKKYAWSVLMNMREIYNQISVIPTPNNPRPKVTTEYFDDRTVVTVFHNLFEE